MLTPAAAAQRIGVVPPMLLGPRGLLCTSHPRLCMRGRLCLVWSATAAHAAGWGDAHAAAWVTGSPSPPRAAAPPMSGGCAKVVIVMVSRLSCLGAGKRACRPACGAQPRGLSKPRGRANHDEHHHFLSCCSRLPGVPASSRGTPKTYSDSCIPWSDVASWRPRGEALLSCCDWQCCVALRLKKPMLLLTITQARAAFPSAVLCCMTSWLPHALAAAAATADGCGCC